jgi:hypothetical protein
MIFPWSFGIEKKYEMEAERYLYKVVQLNDAGERYMRITCPEVRGKVVVNVL